MIGTASPVKLQQGIPASPVIDELGRERQIAYGLEFEQFLRLWADHISNEQRYLRSLCEISVKIHRRARGLTISDQCGQYGTRPETTGRWLEYDPDLDGEIHPINIVGPALNTNQNACLQSQSATEVTSANQSARNQQIAQRWQRTADYFERTGWDEASRAFIFDAVQKDGTTLIRSYKEKVDTQTVASVRQKKIGLAMFECQTCGEVGMSETEDAEEGIGEIPCPKCGAAAPAMVSPIGGYDMEDSEVPAYELKQEVIPFYNFAIDTAGAKIRGIQGAEWLQVQRLVSRVKLATKYPDKQFNSGAANWSYQTQCDYALSSGAYGGLNLLGDTSTRSEFRKFEERTIYLHADAYSDYVSPSDYEFTNGFGQTTFAIKHGQQIEEAFEAQYGFCPKGLKFVWIDNRLVDICSPEDDCTNFRECFSDIHWRKDSGSYLSSPYASIVSIQDDLTQLNSMRHNIIARNAFIPVYFDSLIFEQSDFANEFIGSKNAHLLGENRDLSKSLVQLPVPTPSPELSNQMAFLWDIKDDISSVTPAMRGEAQKGETFGAQRQQLEQSYGALTSVLKSFAQCKNDVFRQKAKMAQECWTAEQFQAVGSMFGEEWSEDEIAEMCEIDLDKDLIISYKTGSEMPQSNLDRELRFSQGLAALAQVMQLAEAPLPADKLVKILDKIDDMAQFDFDLTGLEVNDTLAQKRYLDLASACRKLQEQGAMSYDDSQEMKEGVSHIDPATGQPVTIMDVMAEQIFAAAKIQFSQYEDLGLQRSFFTEQVSVELGKTTPDYLLIEALHMVIESIDAAAQQMQAEAVMNDPQMQMQMAQEEALAGEKEAAKVAENEKAGIEREDKEKERMAGAESEERAQMLDLAKMAAQQEHEVEMAKMQKPPAAK